MSDSLAEAAARLEAAVERLAAAARAVSEARSTGRGGTAGVPPAEVAALSARLEATIARLRAALPEGGELPEGIDLPDDPASEEGLAEDAAPDEDEPGGMERVDDDPAAREGAGAGRPAGEG